MVEKIPLVSHRLRHVPNGVGWVDHRLLREGHIRECSSDSLALYLLLICAAAGQGLSYLRRRAGVRSFGVVSRSA